MSGTIAGRVLEAAERCAPSGNVAAALDRIGLRGYVARAAVRPDLAPDESTRRLRHLYDTLLLEAAGEISAQLDTTSIGHFFAKGSALLGSCYEPGERTVSDIDLFVPDGDVRSALQVLGRLGFRELPESQQVGPPPLRSTIALERSVASEVERVAVDLHWALDPVDRLLPRPTAPVPSFMFDGASRDDGLPVPSPAHHAALLAHHLVHTDLLHLRSAVDMALILRDAVADGGNGYLTASTALGIEVFARAIATTIAADCDVAIPHDVLVTGASPRLLDALGMDRLMASALASQPGTTDAVTVSRVRTRLLIVGWRAALPLLADALFPPRSFLRWRWPERGRLAARAGHLFRVGTKIAGRT